MFLRLGANDLYEAAARKPLSYRIAFSFNEPLKIDKNMAVAAPTGSC